MPGRYLFDVSESLGGRFWSLADTDENSVRQLSLSLGTPDFISRLLSLRGVNAEAAPGFLSPKLRDSFPDPSAFQDMEKAAGLVLDAIAEGRKVTVFADYDVDGGTSSALLARYFRAWGRDLGLYVPDRLTEGYGPSPAAFRYLKEQGADLVVTVDCGAAATEALEEAGIERAGVGLPQACLSANAGRRQNGQAAAGDLVVGILAGDNHPRDTGLHQPIGTGWGLSMMGAGFQRDVGSCPGGLVSGRIQRDPFGVRSSTVLCGTGGDDPPLFDEHASDCRIGGCTALAGLRQRQRKVHVASVVDRRHASGMGGSGLARSASPSLL